MAGAVTGAGAGGAVQIRVAALLERPRGMPAAQAEDVYRASETLALGLDIALAERGVKRTNLMAQRVNRVAFAEAWAPPAGWAAFESALIALGAGRAVLDEAGRGDPALAEIRLQIAQGTWPTPFPHLLGHAEPPWYYVPREFPLPFWVLQPQPQSHAPAGPARILSIGSVPRLVQELEALEPLLATRQLDPAIWFPAPLLEATAVSLETGLAIVVTRG